MDAGNLDGTRRQDSVLISTFTEFDCRFQKGRS